MKLNKFFKWGMIVLILISVAILVWGFIKGFVSNDGQAVDLLLYWAYIMVAIAVICCIVIGLIISIKNDPKSLVKLGLILVCAAVLCLVAYLLAPGNFAMGREGMDSALTLKLTDTILNLTYICGGAAVLAIIVGEIRMAIVNKK